MDWRGDRSRRVSCPLHDFGESWTDPAAPTAKTRAPSGGTHDRNGRADHRTPTLFFRFMRFVHLGGQDDHSGKLDRGGR